METPPIGTNAQTYPRVELSAMKRFFVFLFFGFAQNRGLPQIWGMLGITPDLETPA